MQTNEKCYELFWNLYNTNPKFKEFVSKNLENKKIRFFNEEEWEKITSQNFLSPTFEMKEFIDMFHLGYNIGNCVGTSIQLSYSYDDVSIVSGRLPLLKGTKNALKEGGHCWLETTKTIIDTSLMLVMDKSLKEELGYIEEQRINEQQLKGSPMYQARKEFVNDKQIKNNKKKK